MARNHYSGFVKKVTYQMLFNKNSESHAIYKP